MGWSLNPMTGVLVIRGEDTEAHTQRRSHDDTGRE